MVLLKEARPVQYSIIIFLFFLDASRNDVVPFDAMNLVRSQEEILTELDKPTPLRVYSIAQVSQSGSFPLPCRQGDSLFALGWSGS